MLLRSLIRLKCLISVQPVVGGLVWRLTILAIPYEKE